MGGGHSAYSRHADVAFTGDAAWNNPILAIFLTLATLASLSSASPPFLVILRQSLGSKFLPIHVLVAQFFMLEGFTIGYCAMIPVALAAYEMSRPRVRLGSTSALHEIAASKKRHQL